MNGMPDKHLVKDNIKLAQQIDSWLKKALDEEREEIARLRKTAEYFFNAKWQAALEAMDVEMLTQGKQKIRVSYLRSAGIENMWQVSKMSRLQIEAIDGIGAQGAAVIYDTAKQIAKNAREKLSVRIQDETPAEADDALVTALYCLIIHSEQRTQLREIYERHHKPLVKEIAAAQKAANGLSLFFATTKEREAAAAAAAALQERLDGEFGDPVLPEAYEAVFSADVTEWYAHFRDNAARYYAALEKYCKQLSLAQETKAGLPAELVAQIEAVELDLSGLKATLIKQFSIPQSIAISSTILPANAYPQREESRRKIRKLSLTSRSSSSFLRLRDCRLMYSL